MARTNKFTSINFNDIFEKKANPNPNPNPNPKSSSSSSPLTQTPYSSSLHKPHGGMLVLTRPTPKPLHPQNPKPQPQPQPQSDPDSSNPISLRPQAPQESKKEPQPHLIPAATPSLKPEPFVPPHLRPGFAGKEEKFGANGQRILNQNTHHQSNQNNRSVDIGVPNGFAENGRPRTVGGYERGYERMRRGGGGGGGEYDGVVANDMNRPSSSGGYGGNRPGSSGGGTRPGSGSGNRPGGGWYGASYRSPTHH